ncbi:MAG: T9SS type A sorting domain-containing protein, partial [Sphingobacteriales bacterium]
KDGKGGVRLYPNPNRGSFTVAGITSPEVHVEIINAVGQVVYRDRATQLTGELTIKAQLTQGIYLIKLQENNNQKQTLKFTVAE